MDSGATEHMTGKKILFESLAPCPDNRMITVANGSSSLVEGIGTVKLSPYLVLHDVLFVPIVQSYVCSPTYWSI